MKTKGEIEKYYIFLEKQLQKELKNPSNIRNALLLQEKIKVLDWILQPSETLEAK